MVVSIGCSRSSNRVQWLVVAHYFTAFQISISEKKKRCIRRKKKNSVQVGKKRVRQQEVKCRLDKHSAMLCNAPKCAHESTTFMAVYF